MCSVPSSISSASTAEPASAVTTAMLSGRTNRPRISPVIVSVNQSWTGGRSRSLVRLRAQMALAVSMLWRTYDGGAVARLVPRRWWPRGLRRYARSARPGVCRDSGARSSRAARYSRSTHSWARRRSAYTSCATSAGVAEPCRARSRSRARSGIGSRSGSRSMARLGSTVRKAARI